MTFLSIGFGGFGLALTSALRLQTFGFSHSRLQVGCTHWSPGLQFQLHCGLAQRLSQALGCGQSAWHAGGLQIVLHLGHSECSHCVVGQMTAHFGGSHFHWQEERLIRPHAVWHCGGAQVGVQVSSHPADPQFHLHCGWQPTLLLSS